MENLSRFKKLIAALLALAVAVGGFWFAIIKTGFPQPPPPPTATAQTTPEPTALPVDATAMSRAVSFEPVGPCDINKDGTCNKQDLAAQCSKKQLDAGTCDRKALGDIELGIKATQTAAKAGK